MDQDISTSTMGFEGYSPEEWGPVLRQLEQHNWVRPFRPDNMSLDAYLKHEENITGGNPSYIIGDDVIFVWLEYSPYLRSKYGIMLRGNISINTKIDLEKIDFEKTRDNIAKHIDQNNLAYLYSPEVESYDPDLAAVEVPEGYDFAEWRRNVLEIDSLLSKITVLSESKKGSEQTQGKIGRIQDLL